jgi:hypothetical protein
MIGSNRHNGGGWMPELFFDFDFEFLFRDVELGCLVPGKSHGSLMNDEMVIRC